jgi:non-canonical poly(A) RNA polymerase PAPD5/7
MHPLVQSGEIYPEENLGVLLIEFLELYGKYFNFHELGIGVNFERGAWYFRKVCLLGVFIIWWHAKG